MYEDSNVTEVVSVKFKGRGKAYYFDANGITVKPGEDVIVETSKGLEYAQCVYGNHYVSNDKVVPPIRPVVRIATDNDRRVQEINHKRESEALDICREKVAEHGLDMKLVDVECSFEGNKITFYFTSDGRVDFRELVKDLAGVFRSRIELRQIGVRDEAKMLGGIGMCGRPLCCNQFLTEFQPVSTKMAKTQGLSLNPTKISGTCGRLMCCLRYEEEAYESLVKAVPKNGAFVETPAGYGTVIQVNLLRGTVKVKLDGDGEAVIKTYNGDEVAAVPGGRPKNGETPPHVLEVREREPEEPRQEAAPAYDYAEETAEPAAEESETRAGSTAHVRRKSGQKRGGRRGEQKRDEKPAANKPREKRERDEKGDDEHRRERRSKQRDSRANRGEERESRASRGDERESAAPRPQQPQQHRPRRRGSRGGKRRSGGAAEQKPTE